MRLIAISLLLCCCAKSPDQVHDLPGECEEASQRLGQLACLHRIDKPEQWEQVALAVDASDKIAQTKYLIPARQDARLPTVFMNAQVFEVHYRFLLEAFGDKFAAMDYPEYVRAITHPQQREFYSGDLLEYRSTKGESIFGFTLWDQQTDFETSATCEDFLLVHGEIKRTLSIGPVVVVPATPFQRQRLEDCPVPQYDASDNVDYEAYTVAVGYGTLRRYTLAKFHAATEAAEFGWQDILVIDQAPFDVETVISGAITGTRQGELSHLNVRSAARKTPNCYQKEAYSLLEAFEGMLVRVSCESSKLSVEIATPEQAESFWSQLRPEPIELTEPDLENRDLVSLPDLPTATPQQRLEAFRTYGGKGTHLAWLYGQIDRSYQLAGFLVPFYYYDAFMRSGTMTLETEAGLQTVTFVEAVDHFLADLNFQRDGAVRRIQLRNLQQAMRSASCDPDLLVALEEQIMEVFSRADTMVRFRSSSNAEDSLAFNGAGIYDSTSACLSDELDANLSGPSLCDPDQPKPRSLCRALTKVWASLWNPVAFEERSWFGIDHRLAAMGILVNTRTKSEQANIVAFTGNPVSPGDPRYLINAQYGELDVVGSSPERFPEKVLLTMDGTHVVYIDRIRTSSEMPQEQWILDDLHLTEIGSLLWGVSNVFPVDETIPVGYEVLLDTELKIQSDGQLIIKQVRPFLR